MQILKSFIRGYFKIGKVGLTFRFESHFDHQNAAKNNPHIVAVSPFSYPKNDHLQPLQKAKSLWRLTSPCFYKCTYFCHQSQKGGFPNSERWISMRQFFLSFIFHFFAPRVKKKLLTTDFVSAKLIATVSKQNKTREITRRRKFAKIGRGFSRWDQDFRTIFLKRTVGIWKLILIF